MGLDVFLLNGHRCGRLYRSGIFPKVERSGCPRGGEIGQRWTDGTNPASLNAEKTSASPNWLTRKLPVEVLSLVRGEERKAYGGGVAFFVSKSYRSLYDGEMLDVDSYSFVPIFVTRRWEAGRRSEATTVFQYDGWDLYPVLITCFLGHV